MSKIIDVLGQNIIPNFIHALNTPNNQFDEQLNHKILNASEAELNDAITSFFNEVNAFETAQALDIHIDHIQALQLGLSAKNSQYLSDVKKIVMLSLALETDILANLEISDCLQDYPM